LIYYIKNKLKKNIIFIFFLNKKQTQLCPKHRWNRSKGQFSRALTSPFSANSLVKSGGFSPKDGTHYPINHSNQTSPPSNESESTEP
jgi:hypothetical protein